METTPIPNQTPKILTSMGSVFGSPLQGFALISKDNAPAPTTAERTAAVMPIDVLTRDVATLQSQVMDLKSLMAKMEEEIRVMKELVSKPKILTTEDVLIAGIPNYVAPEKKKPGRPKKV